MQKRKPVRNTKPTVSILKIAVKVAGTIHTELADPVKITFRRGIFGIEIIPIPFLDSGWKPVEDLVGNHLYGDMPNGVSVPLYFYNNNSITDWNIARDPLWGNHCDSREVVFEVPADMPYEVDIDGTYKLTLGFFASGQTGWYNSALHLYLGSL